MVEVPTLGVVVTCEPGVPVVSEGAVLSTLKLGLAAVEFTVPSTSVSEIVALPVGLLSGLVMINWQVSDVPGAPEQVPLPSLLLIDALEIGWFEVAVTVTVWPNATGMVVNVAPPGMAELLTTTELKVGSPLEMVN